MNTQFAIRNSKFRLRAPCSLLLGLVLVSCSAPYAVKEDPVGATLFALKVSYEEIVRQAGYAYQRQEINKQELDEILAGAQKFYEGYRLAVEAHYLGQIDEASKRAEALNKLFADLEQLVIKYTRRGFIHSK